MSEAAVVPTGGQRLSSLTRRQVSGVIAAMAAPVVLGQMSQTLMGLIDTLMIGRLGDVELASVAVATLLFSALAMTIKSVDVAVQSYTARRVGEGRDAEVGPVLTTALSVCFSLGIVCMAIGLIWPEALMRIASRDETVRELGSQYLFYRYAGILPLLFYFQAKGVFDGIGWTRIGMMVGIGMNVLNVFLNAVFIFGKLGAPAMGPAGAALASSLSGLMAALVMGGILFYRPHRMRFQFVSAANFQRGLVGPFLRLAWPPAIQTFGVVIALIIFNYLLGLVSVLAVAAGNVVLRIASLSFMPGFGVGAALQTLVGQSLGRDDPLGAQRAIKGGVVLAVILMGLLGIVFVARPEFLLKMFSSSSALINEAVPILRLMGVVQVIDAVGLTLAGAMRGAGMTRAVMLADVGTGFVLLPPMTYLFAIVWQGGLMGAWLALLTWFSLFAVVMVIIYWKSDWQEVEI
ncbi:MAG: MATE family multidrug resistance protein [Candidatus Krumholzibacteriia bacterium]|jgi:MATE family multidrug resistance protein